MPGKKRERYSGRPHHAHEQAPRTCRDDTSPSEDQIGRRLGLVVFPGIDQRGMPARGIRLARAEVSPGTTHGEASPIDNLGT